MRLNEETMKVMRDFIEKSVETIIDMYGEYTIDDNFNDYIDYLKELSLLINDSSIIMRDFMDSLDIDSYDFILSYYRWCLNYAGCTELRCTELNWKLCRIEHGDNYVMNNIALRGSINR